MTSLSADLTTIALLQALAGLNMNEPLEHRSILDMTTTKHIIVETGGVIYVIGPRRGHTWHDHKGMWEVCKIDNAVLWDSPEDEAIDRENARKIRDSLDAIEANQARIAELSKALKNATDALTYCHRGMVDDPLEPKVAVTLKSSLAALSIPS